MRVRRGEERRTWFRSDRCFCVGTEWFVSTREGHNVGPFKSRDEALCSIHRYLSGINVRKDAGGFAGRIATQGVWATNNYI